MSTAPSAVPRAPLLRTGSTTPRGRRPLPRPPPRRGRASGSSPWSSSVASPAAWATATATSSTFPPRTPSRGSTCLDRDFRRHGLPVAHGTIVFRAEQGVDDPAVQAGMTKLFDEVAQRGTWTRLESPYDPANADRLVSSPRGHTRQDRLLRTSTSPKTSRRRTRPKIRDFIDEHAGDRRPPDRARRRVVSPSSRTRRRRRSASAFADHHPDRGASARCWRWACRSPRRCSASSSARRSSPSLSNVFTRSPRRRLFVGIDDRSRRGHRLRAA